MVVRSIPVSRARSRALAPCLSPERVRSSTIERSMTCTRPPVFSLLLAGGEGVEEISMVAAASEIIMFGKRGSQAWPVAKVSRDPLLGEALIYVSKNT